MTGIALRKSKGGRHAGRLFPEEAEALTDALHALRDEDEDAARTRQLPSFTPRETAPLHLLARPHIPAPDAPPAKIFDSMPPLPEPEQDPEPPPGYEVPLDSRAQIYSGPGWTRALTAARVRSGEWDELPAIIETGLGRNAAEMHTSLRHNRERFAEAWRDLCIIAGRADRIADGWRRIDALSAGVRDTAQHTARAVTGRSAA